jgi:hypothetical protein
VAISKEKADTVRNEDALLHRETLFVIAARDAENIALEFFANGLSWDFLRQFLVIEHATGKLKSDRETCKEHRTHYFLSSSISMVFCCPVAGSIGDGSHGHCKDDAGCEDALAILNFILE